MLSAQSPGFTSPTTALALLQPCPGAAAASSPRGHLPAQLLTALGSLAPSQPPPHPQPPHKNPSRPHGAAPSPLCTRQDQLGHQPGWGMKEQQELGVLEPSQCPLRVLQGHPR